MSMMMSEYVRPEETIAMSANGDESDSVQGKRKNSWRFNNNILDLEAIEKNSKAYSSKDASEINESPMMSPTLPNKSKKSKFAPAGALEDYTKKYSHG
jgi:hypothetical protein